ncbi:MAG: AI-2E family transporter, partial [Alphaproteobacteria bacterium]|nr:AI-2E family transporter [Alphaproteobacteria bacterium]
MTSPAREESQAPPSQGIPPIAFVVMAAIILWLLSDVVLVIFASILIAIALLGLADPITKLTHIPHRLAVLIATLIIAVTVSVPFMLFGSRLLAQYDSIAQDIPQTILTIGRAIEAHPWGRFLEGFLKVDDLSKLTAPLTAHVLSFATSTSKVLSYVVLMLLGGIYFAMDPDRYIDGLMYFTPMKYKNRMRSFITRSGPALHRWLFTQLLVVVMNALFAGVALWAFEVDAPVALAILGGALAFIPYVGTIVAMTIGALASLPQGPAFAFYAVLA